MVYHLERRKTSHLSKRQIRFILFGAVGFFIFVLWFTADLRGVQNREIYEKTMQGMKEKDQENKKLGEQMAQRLKAADEAKKKPPVAQAKPAPQAATDKQKPEANSQANAKPAEEKYDVKAEMYRILEKSPVTIFSKTYCPYSKKAKHILLEVYHIVPPPYVVELDEHPHGAAIQDYLQEKTGRRTVPNVMVHSKSIGGGDDIALLDTENLLIKKIKELAGKRVESIKKVD